MSGAVHPLKGKQQEAVDPRECVWLSASAGTGKTQVLSARVLRLLLQPDVQPSDILCLTFTKAGAAEMAERVNDVLARWVRLESTQLARELVNIGASNGPDVEARARSLFAKVLDCPGGGLRIDTIHAFSQFLLATFPEEAGIPPGSTAMEDRTRDLLSNEVLNELFLTAKRQDDRAVLEAIETLSRKKGPDDVRKWLMRCTGAADLWEEPGAWRSPMRPRLCSLLGLPADASLEHAAALCADDAFDMEGLKQCAQIISEWGKPSGQEMLDFIVPWISMDAVARFGSLDGFRGSLLTKGEGSAKNLGHLKKFDPQYEANVARVIESIQRVTDMKTLIELADFAAPLLELGGKFARLWEEAKAREGLVDFDDQIRQAASLLTQKDIAPWIRYKLDRQFDHILVDEAQDTNPEQWAIIDALIDDFFSGEGAHGDKLRTVFAVGDYKQAIFRFQGTSPENFRAAKERVKKSMDEAAENLAQLRSNIKPRKLQDLDLGQSFRTGERVLELVDKVVGAVGQDGLGLDKPAEAHKPLPFPGQVTLWHTVKAKKAEDAGEEEGEQGWLPKSDRILADRIAEQVSQWLEQGYLLVRDPENPRNAGPGDIMVLLRKRGDLANQIVARLHAKGVPVAGVDRLRLGAPLAVRDLMAALRFAAQPFDDLNLACLLVSPLIGWSQQDLLDLGYRSPEARKAKVSLWQHLRDLREPRVQPAMKRLLDLLGRADFEPPLELLEYLLTGPWDGRRKLVARLGSEANDPIDELLNSALAYASSHTISLQGFIRWFDAGTGDVKRESEGAGNKVRVMTVHGSKGLQAPIVILADAAGAPDLKEDLALKEQLPGSDKVRTVPLPGVNKADRVGPLAEVVEQSEKEMLQEHWRLLYVAMTRAEEALFVGGALNKKQDVADELSWYKALQPHFGEALEDPIWQSRWETGPAPAGLPQTKPAESETKTKLPGWANTPIGPEPRPPRPLAPSSAGEDLAPDPPLAADAARQLAALRGTLVHRLLERLPELPEVDRALRGTEWLAKQAAEIEAPIREEMLQSALDVLANPEWAPLFGLGSLAEVPFAATVEGQVIAGTVDRLLVEKERVLVVDYKTARRPPQSLGEIPLSTIRQMAAYHVALSSIYPGRTIEIAVLYTHSPQLFAIPAEQLRQHKPQLQVAQ